MRILYFLFHSLFREFAFCCSFLLIHFNRIYFDETTPPLIHANFTHPMYIFINFFLNTFLTNRFFQREQSTKQHFNFGFPSKCSNPSLVDFRFFDFAYINMYIRLLLLLMPKIN